MISPHAKNATMNQVSRSNPSLLPFPLSSTRAEEEAARDRREHGGDEHAEHDPVDACPPAAQEAARLASAITSFANRLRHDSACDSSSWIASSGAEPPVALARTSDMTCSS